MTGEDVKKALSDFAQPERAKNNEWFFKAGKGEYGAGDQFIGVSVPNQRRVAKRFKDLPLSELEKLFQSPVHEHRLTACLLSVYKYQTAKKTGGDTRVIFLAFLQQLRKGRINNWDMVDTSVPQIIGDYLLHRQRDILDELAQGGKLWEQRAAIMATQAFIKNDDFADTLRLAEELLLHQHDLIHKAVGWMLREVGNKDRAVEEEFLARHYKKMPRTMLRYAIEKFPDGRRRMFLTGRV